MSLASCQLLHSAMLLWLNGCCFPFASAKVVTFPELTKCFAENVLKNILILDEWHKDALSVQFFDAFFAHFGVFV